MELQKWPLLQLMCRMGSFQLDINDDLPTNLLVFPPLPPPLRAQPCLSFLCPFYLSFSSLSLGPTLHPPYPQL